MMLQLIFFAIAFLSTATNAYNCTSFCFTGNRTEYPASTTVTTSSCAATTTCNSCITASIVGYAGESASSYSYLAGQVQMCGTSCPNSSITFSWTSSSGLSSTGVTLSGEAISNLTLFYTTLSATQANATFASVTCNSAVAQTWQFATLCVMLTLLTIAIM